MKKIWKYIVGIFTFLSGFISIFLATNKKVKKVKEIKDKVKKVETKIKNKQKQVDAIEKSMKSKKKALEERILRMSSGQLMVQRRALL